MTKCIMDHETNRQNHGRTVDIQHPKYDRITKSERKAHGFSTEHIIYPIADTKKVIISEGDFRQGTRRDTYGHLTIVNNPDRTISVLEPRDSGGCQNQIKSTVMETSTQKSCIVAVNAGFFDPRPGNVCLGNIISDGRVVMESQGVQNVHFGITNDGFLHFGMTLYEFADVLLDYGFVQAINLDGGGSTTLIINGTLVNHPTDKCENDTRFTCARKVSTILCVHSAYSTRLEENDKSECDFKTISNISEHCKSSTIGSKNIKQEVQRDSDNQ
ncbi:NAGPA [Mytilus coruscus]|uniref:NAGPA n=1 Tax=Mytilus coruscus TaxID=42192 RepID=A0A6J8DFJ1_MYTCO|nr:NAGPA [Mytilus coruscus]